MGALLGRWRLDEAAVRRRMYRAPTPRERWRSVWLLTPGWTAAGVGRALERDAHTIGQWAKAFAAGGAKALVFEPTGGSPRVGRGATSRVESGGAAIAVAGGHSAAGGSNWNWQAVRQFVRDRFGLALSRSPPQADLNYPVSSTEQARRRLGFALKRPKKRLLKADPARREAFVGEYAALTVAAARTGTKIFFADATHFQADAELRGKWTLQGEPAPVSGYVAGPGGLHQPAPR